MADYNTVRVAVEDEIGTLTVDRPEARNALSPECLREIGEALDEIRDNVRVLVVTGAGDKAFSAGLDLKKYFRDGREAGPERVRETMEHQGSAFLGLKDFPMPTIAKVNGWAAGGGYMLMAVCDLAIAAEDAQFVMSEINFGIPPGGGAMWSIVHTTNRRDAYYYSVTGETFDGMQADEMGAINEAVPRDQLDDRVDELAQTIREKNKMALEYNKIMFEKARFISYEESRDYEYAKGEELKYLQNYEFLTEGIGQFAKGEYQPGTGETYKSPSESKN